LNKLVKTKELYATQPDYLVELFEGSEYPSRMKKGQKFVPIITLVLYMGKDKLWDGARSLYEMLEIDDAVKPFVNDYKLNLFDYHDYENFDVFKTENRILFEMLMNSRDKNKMLGILKKNTHYGKVDEESAKAILGILNVNVDLDKIVKKDEAGREVYDMCQAFEDYKEEGREEMALENVKKLMRKQKLSFEEVMELLELPVGMQNELRKLI